MTKARPACRAGLILPLTLALLLPLSAAARAESSPAACPAQDEARAEQAHEEGVRRYRSGDYAAALELLVRAQELCPLPNGLYNIGRCHQRLGNHREARIWLRRFVAAAPERAALAEAVIARLQEPPRAAASPGDVQPTEPSHAAAEPAATPAPTVVVGEDPPPRVHPGAWVLWGTAALALGTSGVLAYRASVAEATVHDRSLSRDEARGEAERAVTEARLANAGLLTAGVATAAAVLVHLLSGGPDAAGAPRASVGPSSVGVSLWF